MTDKTATLTFLELQDSHENEKLYQVYMVDESDNPEFRDTNLVFAERANVIVHDLRGIESQFDLDNNGFIVRTKESQVKAFNTQKEIEELYLPEMADVIRREVDDVDRVYFFDWRVSDLRGKHLTRTNEFQIRRNERTSQLGKSLDMNDRMTHHLLPIRNVHVGT